MKVLNYTTSYLAVILLVIITIWAAIFYYAMLDEIYDSIDDGLDNQKGLILQKLAVDSTILRKADFEETGYAIRELNMQAAKRYQDEYIDTMMYMQNEQDYEPVRLLRTAFAYNGKYYEMHVATSMVEEDDLVTELFYALLWLYLGLLATILLLNNFLLKRIWRPFYFLIRQLKTFRLENPSIQVKKTGIDEFRQLNEAVQKMLQSSVNTYTSQKQFIENASHELQTPLAISINKLEALAESGPLNDEQSTLLGAALENLERLTRLNRSLLLLLKIENRQFATEEVFNLNELVKKVADDFSDQLDFSQINLNIEELDKVAVKMNADLATILVINLVKNAILHNHPGGSITVELDKDSLQISNTGKKESLDTEKLFTRFYKERQSHTSSGLGLSIVKAIGDLYGFTISYQYQDKHILRVDFIR